MHGIKAVGHEIRPHDLHDRTCRVVTGRHDGGVVHEGIDTAVYTPKVDAGHPDRLFHQIGQRTWDELAENLGSADEGIVRVLQRPAGAAKLDARQPIAAGGIGNAVTFKSVMYHGSSAILFRLVRQHCWTGLSI